MYSALQHATECLSIVFGSYQPPLQPAFVLMAVNSVIISTTVAKLCFVVAYIYLLLLIDPGMWS